MSKDKRLYHVVSIAGAVRDRTTLFLTKQGKLVEVLEGTPMLAELRAQGEQVPPGFRTLRIGGAKVEIVEGPPAYRNLLAAQEADPARSGQRERINTTYSQADGIYRFVDLPPGPYKLRVTAPEMGTRYGECPAGPVNVQKGPDDDPPFAAVQADADLPPTRIWGKVTAAGTTDPIPGARVRLLGDTTIVKTDKDGSYALTRLVASKPTIEVTAAGFKKATRKIELAAGQDRQDDFALDK
jgi:hypothetical protein